MELLYVFLAFLAGSCAPTQAGINAQLALWTKNAVSASLINFIVGTAAVLLYILALRVPVPPIMSAGYVPWWMWTGGILGAYLVVVSVIVAHTLGAATMMGFMVAGQMLTGVVLDHFGLIGYQTHPTTIPRLVGVILVVLGTVLIKKF
jgi:bacterial/archaeal transporter family-2 protein